jgi:O-antigen ligase
LARFPAKIVQEVKSPGERSKFAYRVMLVFSFLYFFRPGDIIPGLSSIPMAKITGIIAVLALIVGASKDRPKKLPLEVKLILAMFGWMIITIPFAFWKSESLQMVFLEFLKAVIIALILTVTVTRMDEVRKLISVHALAVGLMTLGSIAVNHRINGRLAGLGEGLISNPNDLAINIAISWPLCFAFFLRGKGIVRKGFWSVCLMGMLYAVMQTYSRSGFLALMLGLVLCLYEFGVRGKRVYMVLAAVLAVLMFAPLAPQNYSKRLETLLGERQRGDKDKGSAEAREDLLIQSIKVTAEHPLFGVGPGNFQSYTQLWRVTHNTYTEFSSECGIPALLLFLYLMRRTFWKLSKVRKLKEYGPGDDMRLFAGAVWAGMGAYMLGAFFSSTAFQLFPYYMVTYAVLLYKLAFDTAKQPVTPEPRPSLERPRTQRAYSHV